MLRNIANGLIALYLLPFKISPKVFYYVKGVFFTSGTEHLYWATRYIKRHTNIPADSIVIDVGGFDGATSLYFAREFPNQKVHCFEPNARMWTALDQIEAAHPQIIVRKLALGREKGEAVLHVTANDVSSSLNEISSEETERTPLEFQASMREEAQAKVPVSTLDDEFRDSRDILLMKLDTQGLELEILRSGLETLKKTRFILTEMDNHQLYKNACQYYEVDEFMRQHSFKLVDIVVSYRGDDGMAEYDALYQNVGI
ncbi:MAG TPA: FkbM family methyltransferase [Pyrinomonadaceae bacterium]|nr:FkbM family methyltransferase [Pyrinomonadaceae bacterium]